ncbi:unnamed protein product, partial [marine sediment metagenome]
MSVKTIILITMKAGLVQDNLRRIFKSVVPAVDYASLRYHRDIEEPLTLRLGVLEPEPTEV